MEASSFSLQQVSFNVAKRTILAPVSLEIPSGKITAILGPNGSGKSTLLKLLSGLSPVSSGDIELLGKPMAEYSRKGLAKLLTMLPQHSPVPLGMKVADLVACGRHPYAGPFGRLQTTDRQAIHEALVRVGMSDVAGHVVDHLSGGEMQRVWLAMVLAQQTGILLLDEPTSWLDISHQQKLLDTIRTLNQEQKVTVVWVLHDLNQALQYSDHLVLMKAGKLVQDGPAHTVLNEQTIYEVFDIKTRKVTLEPEGQTLFIPGVASLDGSSGEQFKSPANKSLTMEVA
ncbi:ABC transporter ATP-binding protein [Endozoicomonas gorgoniicola]|uniref:ABC transporter ATP-binding protein n=1 Tax=Endozoicomonas gorgoniicola TaxID=1234144 RepID=A0ABT3N0K0_9GAMM|nr:ABC transporter ATP-binding protein [Endozoicomonas gorgoniicola]MCW7555151.1 ABC transporter ATP-binding protein [Endozoicomonas gorgoniicola]